MLMGERDAVPFDLTRELSVGGPAIDSYLWIIGRDPS